MNLQDIGNGYGYIYCTAVDGTTIKFTEGNDKYGVQNIKNRAVGSSPVVASRSATGTITITACAAVGAITDITVCGISILGAPIPCTTIVPAEFATLIGQTINSFVSTPDFTAQAIGDTIYLFSPLTSPETYNGCNIVVDVNTGTITATTTLMTSGVTNNEAYDLTLGARYMLNADYNSSYVTNTLAAVPTALGNYIEITKQIISRGTNVGGTVTNVEILNDTIAITNRVSSSDSYIVDTQGAAATDYLVAINPDGFMQGDRVFLRGNNPGHVVTIVSLPVAGLVSPVVQPNILLTGDIDFVSGSDSYGIELMFIYSTTYKQYIFTEVGRTTSGFALNVGTGLETYVTGTSPFEFRTTKLLAASNLLADYGYKAAQTGTELQWSNNQLTGRTVYVDSVFGVDGTALLFHQEKKFQTIGAAILAIKAARAISPLTSVRIEITPGTYTETVPFDEQDITISSTGGGSIFTATHCVIINAGALDAVTSVDFYGNIVLYSPSRSLSITDCQIDILAIIVTNAIACSFLSCYMKVVEAQILGVLDVNLGVGFYASRAVLIRARTVVNLILTSPLIEITGIPTEIQCDITGQILTETIVLTRVRLNETKLSSTTLTLYGENIMYKSVVHTLSMTMLTYSIFGVISAILIAEVDSKSYLTANVIELSGTSATVPVTAFFGQLHVTANTINGVDLAALCSAQGSIIVSGKVTLTGDKTALFSGVTTTSFRYNVFETYYDGAADDIAYGAVTLDTPTDGPIHIEIETKYTHGGIGRQAIVITASGFMTSGKISGIWDMVADGPTIYIESTNNMTIGGTYYFTGTNSAFPVYISNCANTNVECEIQDGSTSTCVVNVVGTTTDTVVQNAKIVSDHGAFSFGNTDVVVTDIVFLGNANSNKAYAVLDATYGTINSLTAPDYDLVVNANIV